MLGLQGAASSTSPYVPLEQGEGIGSYAKKVSAAGLGPFPNPRLVVDNHPMVRSGAIPWISLCWLHA